MTEELMFVLTGVALIVVIGLFIYSGRQKRAHEDKMAKIRRERKAHIEALKRQEKEK